MHQINRFFNLEDFKNQQDQFIAAFKITVQDCYIQHKIDASSPLTYSEFSLCLFCTMEYISDQHKFPTLSVHMTVRGKGSTQNVFAPNLLTMTSQVESTRSTQNTPLYGKGLKEQQIKSMETTMQKKLNGEPKFRTNDKNLQNCKNINKTELTRPSPWRDHLAKP